MKTVVTGGTGFIGTHLIERLRLEGHEVICLAKDRLNESVLKKLEVETVACDLNEPVLYRQVLKSADIIFHLAGVTRAKRTGDYYKGNYGATKKFVDVCSRFSNPDRFLYVSSLTAVGPRLGGRGIDESSEYHPVSHYGKSKMMAEVEVFRASDRFPVTVVRPTAVYGPRDRDFCQYFKTAKHHIGLLFGRTVKYLNMIYVSDLVEGIYSAAFNPAASGQAFVMGSVENHTTDEICNEIARIQKIWTLKVRLPECLGYVAGAISGTIGKLTKSPTLFNVQKAREAAQCAWTCSIEKARIVLGFGPIVSLHEGVDLTYNWYLRNGWL